MATQRTDDFQIGDLLFHTGDRAVYTVVGVPTTTPGGHTFVRLYPRHVLPERIDPSMVTRMLTTHLRHVTLDEAEAATRAGFIPPPSYEISSRYEPTHGGWIVTLAATWHHDTGDLFAKTSGNGEAATHTVALVRALLTAARNRMRIPPP